VHPIADWNEEDQVEFIERARKLGKGHDWKVGDWVRLGSQVPSLPDETNLIVGITTEYLSFNIPLGFSQQQPYDISKDICTWLPLEGDLMDLPEWDKYDVLLGNNSKDHDERWWITSRDHPEKWDGGDNIHKEDVVFHHKHRLIAMIRAVTE